MPAVPASTPEQTARRHSLRVLSDTEVAILEAVALYALMSADQVCRLFFSYPGSLRYAQDTLKRLYEQDGLLLRSFVPKTTIGGRARYTWRLSTAGRRFLNARGIPVRERFRPSEQPEDRRFLEHTLACTDFLISAALLCRQEPHLSVTVRPEWQLKAKPVRVPDGASDRTVAVIPDGYLDFRNDTGQRLCLALEWDTGAEHRGKLVPKLRHLLAFARGPYQAYGAQLITIALLTPIEPRAAQITTWLEQVLREAQAEDLADAFRVAAGSPTATPPAQLFGAPCWTVPLHRRQVALLEGLR
ncbi:MAG TPA: replication-relaxation family protein [Ktedonobacterales bacterium]|nr:replication-relaxation family protein [Ktedonobacterales bacterium]